MSTHPDPLASFLEYLATKGASRHTLKAYRLDLKDFVSYLSHGEKSREHSGLSSDWGGRQVWEHALNATAVDLRGYVTYLGLSSPATIERRFASIRKFLKWAAGSSLRKAHLPEVSKLPSKQKLAPRWLDRNQTNKLLRVFERHGSRRDFAIVRLLLHTGLRAAELCAANWGDVEGSKQTPSLRVRSGKGAKERLVPLNADARKALAELKSLQIERDAEIEHSTPLVWSTRGPMTPSGLLRMMSRFEKHLGFEATPHTMRHTFCRRLLDANAPLTAIARAAGHSSLEVTARYVTPSLADLRRAVDSISD